MSHVPNSAMPHAGTKPEAADSGSSLSKAAGKIADKARDNPKTAIAAGAAVIAGAVAAAAIPIVRARGKAGDKKAPKTKKSGKES